jgi:hypothetical protein
MLFSRIKFLWRRFTCLEKWSRFINHALTHAYVFFACFVNLLCCQRISTVSSSQICSRLDTVLSWHSLITLHLFNQKFCVVTMNVFSFLGSVRHWDLTLSVLHSVQASEIQIRYTTFDMQKVTIRLTTHRRFLGCLSLGYLLVTIELANWFWFFWR